MEGNQSPTRLRRPAHTRRGIATALLARVEADYLARCGRTEIRADVALHAEPFYRANGYRLVRHAIAWARRRRSSSLGLLRPAATH